MTRAGFSPDYRGIETRLLDGDLVNFRVAMTSNRSVQDVTSYARCAAAQYTLIRGYNFLRHVRTATDQAEGLITADAIYTISPAIPAGTTTIDAEVTVADCGRTGIPTV
ncbi:MAG: hypothetical protein AAFQ64_07425 [Pseudomonadota bacterium]